MRPIKKTPAGGEFALYAQETDGARAEAANYMASQCPQGYDVLEEGEVAVGTQTVSNTYGGASESARSRSTSYSSTTTSSTSEQHEWRVRFQCEGVDAPPAAQEPTEKAAPSTVQPQGNVRSVVVRF